MSRYTFVVQVYTEGPSTLENLRTHERVSVPDLADVGPQIRRWLEASAAGVAVERDPRTPTPRRT
jgi:hypothetical protein